VVISEAGFGNIQSQHDRGGRVMTATKTG